MAANHFLMHCGGFTSELLPDARTREALVKRVTAAISGLSARVPLHALFIAMPDAWSSICAATCARIVDMDRLASNARMATMPHDSARTLLRTRRSTASDAVSSVYSIASSETARMRGTPRPGVVCITVFFSPSHVRLFLNEECILAKPADVRTTPDAFVLIPFSFTS